MMYCVHIDEGKDQFYLFQIEFMMQQRLEKVTGYVHSVKTVYLKWYFKTHFSSNKRYNLQLNMDYDRFLQNKLTSSATL